MSLFTVLEAHRPLGGNLRDRDGASRHPIELKYLYPPKSEAVFYHHVGLWLDGELRCNIVLANVKGVKETWAVITDEEPSLQTLWQYALRFRIEELFLDSKSGAFQLEESRIRRGTLRME